jgi:hypothetical protein
MTYRVMWTTLPAGLTDPGRLAISVVASLQITTPATTLAGHPLANWPAIVNALPALAVEVVDAAGVSTFVAASRAAGAPAQADPALWQALLPPSTPVRRGSAGLRGLTIDSQAPYVSAGQGLGQTYDDLPVTDQRAGAGPRTTMEALALLVTPADAAGRTGRRSIAERAAASAIAATGARTVDPHSPTAVADTVAQLLRDGQPALARAVPIAAYARALEDVAEPQVGPAGPLAPISEIRTADFHQIVGLLLGHPAIALRVGLRLDLTIPAFTGERSIRVVGIDRHPLNGPTPAAQPFSRVRNDGGRFVMSPNPGGEIIDGALDLSPAAHPDRYFTTTLDVASLSAQMTALARAAVSRDASPVSDQLPEVDTLGDLPVRRDTGITLAAAGRASIAAEAVTRTQTLESAAGTPTIGGAVVLFADDVRRGYRFDVAVDGGPFRSLMHRHVAYRAGAPDAPIRLSTEDEGTVDAITLAQQGGKVLAGEELMSFNGWALSAPRPGRSVAAFPGEDQSTTATPPGSVPGVALTSTVTAVPGTIVPLRFGHSYRFAARAVDVAGNALPPGGSDPARAGDSIRYLRTQATRPPVLVPLRRFSDGESAQTLVVRSAGGPSGKTPLGGPCQRHLVPPRATQRLLETHGVFDAAFGTNAAAGQRAAALAMARRESGSLLDPVVVTPNGATVRAPGIAVVTNDRADGAMALPVPRGSTLPNGRYVIHDTPSLLLPYLPDPVVDGVAITGIPGRVEPLLVPYTGSGFPDLAPARLVVVPGTGAFAAALTSEGGRSVLTLTVPPAFSATLRLSSTIRPDRVAELDPAGDDPASIPSGQHRLLSAATEVVLVHAVRQPLASPTLTTLAVSPAPTAGSTSVPLAAAVTVHRPSTGRVDLAATWTDVVDDGTGPLRTVAGRAAVGDLHVDPAGNGPVTAPADQPLELHLGDTTSRVVSVTPTASTVFREYFTTPGSEGPAVPLSGSPRTVTVPNRSTPTPPVIDAVVPTFRWIRTTNTAGQRVRTRAVKGVRVWLRRPWLQTGAGEQLGVVLPVDANAGIAAVTGGLPIQDLVTRWGADPLEELTAQAVDHLTKEDLPQAVLDPTRVHDVDLLEPNAFLPDPGGPAGQTIPGRGVVVGHDVTFDEATDRWFADIDITISGVAWPFVRLALVRLQPNSLPGRSISTVVRPDWVQLPPTRVVRFSKVGPVGVRAVVEGVATRGATFDLRQERPLGAPGDPGVDLGTGDGIGAGWQVVNEPVQGSLELARLRLDNNNPGGLGAAFGQLLAGRVVLEERQNGIDLTGAATSRTVFAETINRADIGMTP